MFKNCFTVVNNNIMVEKVRLGILDACVCKNIYVKEKYRLKIDHFLLKTGFNKPRFCQNIDKFWV